jgi:hypothetical protein
MEQTICLNCQTELDVPFCYRFGQKITHRYTVNHVFHELIHVFTHTDKGIFSFAWNIIRKPGIIALDLVEGKRKRYFNMFQYLIIIIGVVTFLMAKSNMMSAIGENINQLMQVETATKTQEFQQRMMMGIQKNNNIFQMALIPLFVFFSWRFMGKRRKYNYAENIVLHTAASAQSNTVALLTTVLFMLSHNSTFFTLMMLISFGVLLFSFAPGYRQFYKISWLKAIGFTIPISLLSYIVQSLATGIIAAVYININ